MTSSPTGWLTIAIACSWLLAASTVWAQTAAPVELPIDKPIDKPIDFRTDIEPILSRHCCDCHGADEQQSGLRLDSMVTALRGGDSGEKIIVPGDSRQSHLMERINSDSKQLRMPPADQPPLSSSEIQLLARWIDDTSSWQAAREALAKHTFDHWSFQPLQPIAIPQNQQAHPIDAFLQARLSRDGLSMSATAPRRQLIRRLYLVMLGLPPTPAEVEHFVADERADAWDRLVDRVLASPRYGERWAMHWLDLIRFGETNGFETNRERPFAYPYRDWVINALNNDKPYDDFIRQQIAGDQLGEPIATGFLVAGPNDIVKGQDALLGLMQRQDELTDIVNTVGTAFLGLTSGCARCHNHKFDPITQSDFYAMQAVFAGVQHADRQLPLTTHQLQEIAAIDRRIAEVQHQIGQWTGVSKLREPVTAKENIEVFDPVLTRFVRFHVDQTNTGEPCIDELQIFAGPENVGLASSGAKVSSSGDFVHPLHKLEHLNDGQFGNARSWIAAQRRGVWAQVELATPIAIDRIAWGRDRQAQYADRLATDYHIDVSLDGQQWRTVASSRDRRPVEGAGSKTYDLSHLDDTTRARAEAAIKELGELEQQRRTLSNSNRAYCGNFTTAPPIQRLFRGDPTAPREVVAPNAIAALGTLAISEATPEPERRLALAGWIARRDHPLTARVVCNRLWQFHFGTGIVDTPSDFGANGTPPSHPELLDWMAGYLLDHDWSLKDVHRLLLTSQAWQQSSAPRADALAIDGGSRLLWRFPPRRLEAEPIRDCILAVTGQLDSTIGGPGFSAFEVELENVRHYFPKKDYGPGDWRRMIYMTKVRQEKDSVFGVFDCPDASQVTPKRSRSTTPLQALNLLNSRFVLQQSELLADRLLRERERTGDQVQLAYELCYNRACTDEEVQLASDFIRQQGVAQFTRALLNSNEFVFIP